MGSQEDDERSIEPAFVRLAGHGPTSPRIEEQLAYRHAVALAKAALR